MTSFRRWGVRGPRRREVTGLDDVRGIRKVGEGIGGRLGRPLERLRRRGN